MTQITATASYAKSATFALLDKELSMFGTLPPFASEFVEQYLQTTLTTEEMEEVSVARVIAMAHGI